MDKRTPLRSLLYFNFNQSCDCFVAGTKNGFRVLNCEPFKQMFTREFANGGIGIVELLFRCNILALVGGGDSPKYPPTKVMIWDDHQGRAIGELSFRSEVRAVRLRKDRIAVALEHKVLMYNFADLRLVHTIETLSNPTGLLALSPSADHTVLVCPGTATGQVRVELYDTKRTKFIQAHEGSVAALALAPNGKLLATASERGTLVRIFSTAEGARLQELRRGSDPARIYSLAFSRGDKPEWLAVSSDKGTVHVFSLLASGQATQQQRASRQGSGASSSGSAELQQGVAHTDPAALIATAPRGSTEGEDTSSPTRANPTSKLSFVGSYLPMGGSYFSSERSFAQFRLPDASGCRSLVGFGREANTVLVLSATGLLYRLNFDPVKGGHCENTMQAQWCSDE